MAREVLSHLAHLGPNGRRKKEKRRRKEKEGKEKVLERERDSTLSLSFPTIGPMVSSGAREKVNHRRKSFA